MALCILLGVVSVKRTRSKARYAYRTDAQHRVQVLVETIEIAQRTVHGVRRCVYVQAGRRLRVDVQRRARAVVLGLDRPVVEWQFRSANRLPDRRFVNPSEACDVDPVIGPSKELELGSVLPSGRRRTK